MSRNKKSLIEAIRANSAAPLDARVDAQVGSKIQSLTSSVLQEGVKTGISSIRDKVKEFNQDIKEVKNRAAQAGAAEQYVTVNTRNNQSVNPLERLASGLFGAPRSASNNVAAEEIFDMPWLSESSIQSQGMMMEVPLNQPSQAQPHHIDLSNSARTMDGRPASEVRRGGDGSSGGLADNGTGEFLLRHIELTCHTEFNSRSSILNLGTPDQTRKD